MSERRKQNERVVSKSADVKGAGRSGRGKARHALRCGTFIPREQLTPRDRRELKNFERFLRLWPRFKLRMLERPRWQKYLGLTPKQAFLYGRQLTVEDATP